LERGSRDQCPQRSALEPLFGAQPLFLSEAAVMRGYILRPDPLAQVPADSLGHPASVDEYKSRSVLDNQLGQPGVHLVPYLSGHDGLERRPRHFYLEIEPPNVPAVYDGAIRSDVGRAASLSRPPPRLFAIHRLSTIHRLPTIHRLSTIHA